MQTVNVLRIDDLITLLKIEAWGKARDIAGRVNDFRPTKRPDSQP